MTNNTVRGVLLAFFFISMSIAPHAQSSASPFTVPPRDKAARYRRVVSKERIKLVGELKIIPLHGAAYVLVTPNRAKSSSVIEGAFRMTSIAGSSD
jgi:hypothetical protein